MPLAEQLAGITTAACSPTWRTVRPRCLLHSGRAIPSSALDDKDIRFIAELPDQLMVRWRGKAVRILHGHQNPINPDYTAWRSTPDQLTELFFDSTVNLTVIGHTHHPFIRKRANSCLAN